MTSNTPHPLVDGIYVPVITIFHDDRAQSVDIPTYQEHILWMARAGIHGFLVQGSTAEAVSLTFEEKAEITRATRDILDQHGFTHVPVIVGASAQSTAESIILAKQAKDSGGDYILTLPPSYFAASLTVEALESYFTELADESPLPVMIYSYPGASAGIELSSESIGRLAQHPNIVGIKQTDHNVGKMARVAYENPSFVVFGGASDYLLGALAVGAQGTITGIANIAPRVCVEIFDLFRSGKLKEARELQGRLSAAEWSILSGGIPSIKYATKIFRGYGGLPRRPLPESPPSVQERVEKGLTSLVRFEGELEAKAK